MPSQAPQSQAELSQAQPSGASSTKAAHPRPVLALVIRLGAIAAMATMSAMIKYLDQHGVHLIEILFWRQLLALPILITFVMLSGSGMRALATKRPLAHVKRALTGLAGMFLAFGAVTLLPLAEATAINFTMPIWAVILSTFFFKDRPGIWRWSAVLVGFAGILLITQPGMSDHQIPLFGACVALGGAFMVALISFQLAELNKTENPLAIVFYFSLITAPICALGMPFVMSGHSPWLWGVLGALALVGTIGQFLLTAALRYGEVSSVIVMDYTALFWAGLYGWAIFGVLPASSTWMGAPLIIGAGLTITWREHMLGKRRKRAAEADAATKVGTATKAEASIS